MKISGENKPSIVFFGTGPVAAESLKLLADTFAIEAVVTKPKPKHHRGYAPVIELAEKLGVSTLLAENKQDLSLKITDGSFKSQVAVLIDFGIIVARDVIDAFPLGIINSHFSLLPEWRGADPISFAILSGQERTGVSLMQLVEGMDEGPILAVGLQENIDTLTTPELTDKLIQLSYGLLRDVLPGYIAEQSATFSDQLELCNHIPDYPKKPSYSRKLTKQDGMLDPTKPANQLEREVRAYIEWPKSRTVIAGKDVVVTKSHIANAQELTEAKYSSGEIFSAHKQLCLQTDDGVLVIDELKTAGKGVMTGQAFLAGYGQLI